MYSGSVETQCLYSGSVETKCLYSGSVETQCLYSGSVETQCLYSGSVETQCLYSGSVETQCLYSGSVETHAVLVKRYIVLRHSACKTVHLGYTVHSMEVRDIHHCIAYVRTSVPIIHTVHVYAQYVGAVHYTVLPGLLKLHTNLHQRR